MSDSTPSRLRRRFIKAFLVCHQIEFSKTHNIALLRQLIASVDPELVKTLAGADALTPYGVEFRYPGDLPSVSRTDGEKAVRLAEQNARSHYRLTAIIYQCREAGW